MKVCILAGGLGTRLQEETIIKPKPMVEIGGHPILWHIMHIYAAYGFNEFVIALGYRGEVIKSFFLNYNYMRNDIAVNLATGHVEVLDSNRENGLVHLIDTGPHTDTGGRLKRLRALVGNEPFMMTYGDGVANVNVTELLAFHKSHGKLATITAVRPPSRFGGLSFDGDYVNEFVEKPQIGEGWINGGFFVLEPEVLDYIEGDTTVFEHEPLERLASDGQLVAYRHEGFWQCMDTLRDVRLLDNLWAQNSAPWKVWNHE
jgi:glucose-1-phosphate cytidylyltransferase